MKIALCVIATKKYKSLLEPLFESVKKYFLTKHNLTLFIFADSPDPRLLPPVKLAANPWPERTALADWFSNNVLNLELGGYDVCWTPIEHLTFPLPTLFRHKTLLKKERELSNFDYVFHCDADARFVGKVGDEILGEGITATQHPSAGSTSPYLTCWQIGRENPEEFWNLTENFKSTTFEANPDSLAYIAPEERKKYFCGAIQGGLSKKYIEAMKVISKNIDDDLGQNIIARYHDESHWNKYLSENPPATILPFWYCFPESKDWPTRQVAWKPKVYVPKRVEIKMLCLDKDLHGGYYLYRGEAKR